MPNITRVYLIRNGGCEPEKAGQFVGQLDLPLSPDGAERVKRLLDGFSEENLNGVYTSPLLRAKQSAEIFSNQFKLDPIPHEGLKEVDLGSFEGKTFEEIVDEEPDLANEMRKEPVTFRYPGGESFMDLAERAYRAFWEIGTRWEGKKVALFGHSGVNRTIIASVLGMMPQGMFSLEQDLAGVTLIEVVNRFPRIKFLNLTMR